MSFFSDNETMTTAFSHNERMTAAGFSKLDMSIGASPGEGKMFLDDQIRECYLRLESCDEKDMEDAEHDLSEAVRLQLTLCDS